MSMLDPLWTPPEVVGAVGGIASGAPADITDVSIDSRNLSPGALFVALIGPSRDGHDFVGSALENGASAAIVSRNPGRLPDDAPLVLVDDTQVALERLGDVARKRTNATIAAVTGSVGKTGTKEMLALALGDQGRTHKSHGSYNNQWGVPLSLARMPREAEYGVFEIGMNHAGEIGPLTHLVRPDVAVITTVEAAHLEFFDGIEAIADAKAEIFLGMTGAGTAILRRDNPMYDRLVKAADDRGIQQILSFGDDPAADFRLLSADLDEEGSSVEAEIGDVGVSYRLLQPGRHLVLNSLAVLGAVQAMGADVPAAAETLGRFEGVAGRGRQVSIRVSGGTATLIDESYNASPASVRAALAVLALSGAGRRIAVLGDMRELGPQGPDLHRDLAEAVLAAGIDQFFACGDLMRQLYDALPPSVRGAWRPTAEALAPLVAEALAAGDTVMVKGSLGSRMADIVKPLISAGER